MNRSLFNRWHQAERILLLAFLLCLTACIPPKLSVFTTYITRENLASYYVNTPDPALNCPPAGQKLYVTWKLPPEYLDRAPLELRLHIRFYNRTDDKQTIPISDLSGTYIYTLLNEQFFNTEGLQSYKIELFGNNQLLDEWRHLIWVDPIVISTQE